MTRKSLVLALMASVGLAGLTGLALFFFARHEPAFYRRGAMLPGPERQKSSGEFVSEFARLVEGVLNKRLWNAQFTEDQINSYLEEDFIKEHAVEHPLPERITQPRISMEPDRLRLGFRYGIGRWSTVISLDMRVWLVPKEPNMIACEFVGMHAGALPISAHTWLERQLDAIRNRDIGASWYRRNGHPVLLLRFQADRGNPTFRLQELSLKSGMLLVSGHSIESLPREPLLSSTYSVSGEGNE